MGVMSNQPTVYIETTIPSFLAARPSGDLITAGRQLVTRQWWEQCRSQYRVFISQYVLDEAARGDADAARKRNDLLQGLEILDVDAEVIRLAQLIVAAGIIPPKAATDAGHIAVAARYGVDFLVSWNCAHIANAVNYRKIGEVVQRAGYVPPLICTPHELAGETHDV
jgi:predicted nucleic acid-binding protein